MQVIAREVQHRLSLSTPPSYFYTVTGKIIQNGKVLLKQARCENSSIIFCQSGLAFKPDHAYEAQGEIQSLKKYNISLNLCEVAV